MTANYWRVFKVVTFLPEFSRKTPPAKFSEIKYCTIKITQRNFPGYKKTFEPLKIMIICQNSSCWLLDFVTGSSVELLSQVLMSFHIGAQSYFFVFVKSVLIKLASPQAA